MGGGAACAHALPVAAVLVITITAIATITTITTHHNRLLLLTHVSSPVFRISITGTVKDLVTNRCALLTTLDLALLHAFAASQSHDGSFGLFIFGDVEFNV